MSLMDEIRENAKNGTPGPWAHRSYWADDNYREVFGRADSPPRVGQWASIADVSAYDDTDEGDLAEVNARRIAAVPRMEAALLAAEKCAEALEVAYNFIFDEYYQSNRDDGECLPNNARKPVGEITTALAAFREACK
ncbi:hypothetical protein [Salipiger thiooxidans]|uniref:hypothetical protein n=1 Tax=Salipiger thiooxidans TaxID=282683 RepID=UPI001CD5E3B0|nr:hypothetical protein [Salipiger thiooxidans]MCA0846080.1 hypothetical protein [Salipiger thiooxidans]